MARESSGRMENPLVMACVAVMLGACASNEAK
jgi:hypothetical protein